MVTLAAPKTCIGYDNLIGVMREMYYTLYAKGQKPDQIVAAVKPLCAYDAQTNGAREFEEPTFKGIVIVADESIPKDQIHFKRLDQLVGIISGIS